MVHVCLNNTMLKQLRGDVEVCNPCLRAIDLGTAIKNSNSTINLPFRVKSGIFGQTAKLRHPLTLYHSSINEIKNK